MALAKAAGGRDGHEPVPVELDTDTVHVKSIGYERWRSLIEAHPATERGKRWDPKTFNPAALLKCVEEADDEADVTEFLIDARPGEVEHLLRAIVNLHENAPDSPTRPHA